MSVACKIEECPYNKDNECTNTESILIEDYISTLNFSCAFYSIDEE